MHDVLKHACNSKARQFISNYINLQLFFVETLQRFKVAMQKTSKAKEELKDQSSYIELPEMKSKRKECQDAEKQLIEVEKKLGETFYCFYKLFWKKRKVSI